MKNIFVLTTLSVFLTGCSLLGSQTSEQYTTIINDKTIYGSQMFLAECSENKNLTPAAVTFLTTVASGTLDIIGAAVKKSLDDKVSKTTVTKNLASMKELSDKCILIVRGTFKVEKPNGGNVYEYISDNGTALYMNDTDEELYVRLRAKTLKGYISYHPLELRYKGITPTSKGKKGKRDVGLLVGYASPNTEILSSNMPQRLIDFGTLNAEKVPVKFKYHDESGVNFLQETQWQPLSKDADNPTTLVVQVIETERASQLAKILKKAVEESEEEFKNQTLTALGQLDFMKTQQELQAELVREETNKLERENAYQTNLYLAQVAQENLDELCNAESPKKSAIQQLQISLYSAQKTANISAISAEKHMPFPTFTKVNGVCPK